MVGSREHPRGQGRGELIAATLRLIGQRGIHAVKMREIADEANMSLGSVTYHFVERPNVIAAALDTFATEAEKVLTDGLFESTVHTDGDAGAGVRAALVTLFADRTRVLIRAELALEIARSDTQQTYYDRTHTVLTRLLTAAHHYTDKPTDGTTTISDALTELDAVALTTAAQHRRPARFTTVMTAHINALYGVTR